MVFWRINMDLAFLFKKEKITKPTNCSLKFCCSQNYGVKECRNFFSCFRGVWNFVAVQLRHIKKKGDLHPPTGMIRADNHLSHAFCPWEKRSRSQEPQGWEWWSKSTPIQQIFEKDQKAMNIRLLSFNPLSFHLFGFSSCAQICWIQTAN